MTTNMPSEQLQKLALMEAMVEFAETGNARSLVEIMPLVSKHRQKIICEVIESLSKGEFHQWKLTRLPPKVQRSRGRPKKTAGSDEQLLMFLKAADKKYQSAEIYGDNCVRSNTAILSEICRREDLATVLGFSRKGLTYKYKKLSEARAFQPPNEKAYELMEDLLMI